MPACSTHRSSASLEAKPRSTRSRKQFGIYAEPSKHPMAGKEMMHSAFVLLFDSRGKFVTTIAPDDPDVDALKKLASIAA